MKKNEEAKLKWIKKLRPYWLEYLNLQEEFDKNIAELEERMRKECGEDNLEFAYDKMGFGDMRYFGIGFQRDGKPREPNLIHDTELESEPE